MIYRMAKEKKKKVEESEAKEENARENRISEEDKLKESSEKQELAEEIEPVIEKKVEWQLLKILGFFAFLVVVFFVASEVFKQMNQVEVGELTFTRGKFGNIEAYHYPYYFEKDKQLINYNLYVRNNPAENDVPVEGGKIAFSQGITYISVDNLGLKECPQSIIAIADLSNFISGNGITVKSASVNEEEAEKVDKPFVTCENKSERSKVIEIKAAEQTRIDVDEENGCYVISVANCEILKATEKFEVQSLIDAGIGKVQIEN
jgi:hypothetical protein